MVTLRKKRWGNKTLGTLFLAKWTGSPPTTCEDLRCATRSLFSYGGCVDRSIFFEVFSFEVRADPFALAGAGGGEKFDFFQPVTESGQDFLYLLEILSVVGGNSDSSCGGKAAEKLFEICGGNEASFVVSFFWPGVGEIDVETFYGVIRDEIY
jgi:hypothetical protein